MKLNELAQPLQESDQYEAASFQIRNDAELKQLLQQHTAITVDGGDALYFIEDLPANMSSEQFFDKYQQEVQFTIKHAREDGDKLGTINIDTFNDHVAATGGASDNAVIDYQQVAREFRFPIDAYKGPLFHVVQYDLAWHLRNYSDDD